MKTVFQAFDLSKNYGSQTAVDQLNMTIVPGQIYGLIGPNGAGKTTLMKMMTGLSLCSSGRYTLFDESEEKQINRMRRKTGCVIENPAFDGYMSAEQNIKAICIERNIKDKARIGQVLELVGLSKTGSKKAGHFSLGMKQRLGLAIALVAKPDFLVLDEPTNGLDPNGIVEIRQTLLRLNHEEGVTILISSHILSELDQLATHFGIMNHGVLGKEFSAEQLQKENAKSIKIVVNEPDKAILLLKSAYNNISISHKGNVLILQDCEVEPGKVNLLLGQNNIMVESIGLGENALERYYLKVTEETNHQPEAGANV